MDGRSLKRQEEAAKAYCKRNGLALDERSFTDLGVSGYHGANATHGELGTFLELVREGRVPKGSVLIVENIDRLSRLPPSEANDIIKALVNAGVELVTTSPEARYNAANINQVGTWIPLQVAQCLASEESKKKAERLADAWASKRATAGEVKLSRKGPAWLKLTADRRGWVVIEDKAAAVRRAFELAADGAGVNTIAGVLHREHPAGMTGKGWQPGQIGILLRSRSVLGEYQPHVGTCAKKGRPATRKPFGEPIKGYFPAVIDEALFYKVQAAMDGRLKGGGRTTGTPNLFNGILYDARDGRRMTVNGCGGKKVLVSSGAIRKMKGSAFHSVRYDIFEHELLDRLEELTAADVLSKATEAEDRVAAVSGKLTAVNRKLDAVKARAAAEEDVTVFLDLLADLDRQRKALGEELEQARAAAASQEGDNLGQFISLAAMLDDAAPEERDALRAKVRAALRRVVKQIWALVVPQGPVRLCACQVWFHAEGRHRDYLLAYRTGSGTSRCRSLADAAALGPLDLRRRDHARRLEKSLCRLTPQELEFLIG
jgi:DNA invertase Pin-like site-specific DNA recombinase